jgi:NitT/TauT family transport system ATP-binding protein
MSGARVVAGFIPLLDCATLVAAAECGFAAGEGLDLRLVRETSWANIRDRVIVGQFQAAHMLGPMAVASSLGIGHLQVPMIAPVSLGLGGNAIAVSTALHESIRAAGGPEDLDPRLQGLALQRVVLERASAGEPPLVLAMVYPFSCHNYQLRYWLAASGIDPDQDVRLVVIPPPLLVDALREGQVDGFCVGEPWSSVAVAAGVGRIVTTGRHIWPNGPEKVLGLRREWAEANPETVAALVRAIVRAARWCDDAGNRSELARLLSGPRYVGVPAELLQGALAGELRQRTGSAPLSVPDFIVFAREQANCPWPSHALWYYQQMIRWRQVDDTPQARAAALASHRPDLFRAAMATLGQPPTSAAARREQLFDGAPVELVHESGAAT